MWRDYLAVMHPNGLGQIIGWRRLPPKDWFRMDSEGDVLGPFITLRIIQRGLNAPHYKRGPYPGTYLIEARGHHEGETFTAFTRDACHHFNLIAEELPC